MSLTLFFVLSITLSSVFSEHKPCDFSDVQCVTAATNAVLPVAIGGIPGVVESSEPLTLEAVNSDIADLKYTSNDVALYGLTTCKVEELHLAVGEGLFRFDIRCPNLRVETKHYEVSGSLDSKPIKGSGTIKTTYTNCILFFFGHYTRYRNAAGQSHNHIEDHPLQFTTDSFTNEITGLTSGDQAVGQEIVDNFEKNIRETVMTSFMEKFFGNINKVLTAKPTDEIFFQNV